MYDHGMYLEASKNPEDILESKVRNGSSKSVQVVTDKRKGAAIFDNHVSRSHGAEAVNHQRAGGALDTENLALAILGRRERGAGSAVVVEEAVQACSVDDKVLAVEHAETQGIAVTTQAAAVVGIVQGGVGWVRAIGCAGVGLVVAGKFKVSLVPEY